jgi:hypothetical protein
MEYYVVNSSRVICETRGKKGWSKILFGYYRQAEWRGGRERRKKYRWWVERSVNKYGKFAKVSVVVETDKSDLVDKRRTTATIEGILLVSRRRQ